MANPKRLPSGKSPKRPVKGPGMKSGRTIGGAEKKPFRSRTTTSGIPRRGKPDEARAFPNTGEQMRLDSEPAAPDDRLEGRNPVAEAIRAGRTINKIWIASPEGSKLDPTLGRIVASARAKGIPIVEVPRNALDKMSATNIHQGVIAQIASHDYTDLDDMIDALSGKERPPFLLILESLKDSYNLGSVLRISDAAGIDGVIIPRHRSIGLDATVAKASSGAIEYVPVARVANLSRSIDDLKKKGFWVFGTDAAAQTPYDRADYKGPIVLLIGSEGEGLSPHLLNKCDVTVSVPMKGKVNSLNAAVATGIIVFEAMRQRDQKNER